MKPYKISKLVMLCLVQGNDGLGIHVRLYCFMVKLAIEELAYQESTYENREKTQ